MTAEDRRLEEDRAHLHRWKGWGPYLAERQWGTVREDYGDDGNSWAYLTFEESHWRAYRWGEDGLAGLCDYKQRLCFGLALWNEVDPLLKERLFGLANGEGNHGEDVKEYYFYLDNTPTHSYQRFLYKYPQEPFPYAELREGNARRGYRDLEYELIDTGLFDHDRYFDVFVDYAKAAPEDILIEITVHNRGDREAPVHVLPTLWFRREEEVFPRLTFDKALLASHPELGDYYLASADKAETLFTLNETRRPGHYGKDAFHRYLVAHQAEAVNPQREGTKACYHRRFLLAPGASASWRLRLTLGKRGGFRDFDHVFELRRQEADEFYANRLSDVGDEDAYRVARQALAGLLWTKQYYYFDLHTWIEEHRERHGSGWVEERLRNRDWGHMHNDHVIAVPDKWEYPWYAAWDLAFHAVALSAVDLRYAKNQLQLMLQELYMHPNGQLPAYEWNFSDVNPPVHAWATVFLYFNEKRRLGQGDLLFLKSAFHKLLFNFTWWVNRKDRHGRNLFEGGFLGLDNIGVFDRSSPLPNGGYLEQADGTGWMCLFCQNMLEMALELTCEDPSYMDLARKFTEHFFRIASTMARSGEDAMWDEEDGFFYEVLRFPDGYGHRLKVRSMVGLLPLCAASYAEEEVFRRNPGLIEKCRARVRQSPELVANIHDPLRRGYQNRHLLSILTEERLRRVLARMLDEEEFLSDYGIRSLSRHHLDHPYRLEMGGRLFEVSYDPAESTSGMFGGNSNWRGPVWFPVNLLLIRALLTYYGYFGDEFRIECPTRSGRWMNLYQVAEEISRRLGRIFLRDRRGRRPVYGGTEKFQSDPHWRDYILFYEYFHGDNGAGLGASHQTGWTALVGPLLNWFRATRSDEFLEQGRR